MHDLRRARFAIEWTIKVASLYPKGYGGHRHDGGGNPLLKIPLRRKAAA